MRFFTSYMTWSDRFQVPGEQYVEYRPHLREGWLRAEVAGYPGTIGGAMMVAICHNMHLGDAWEWADQSPLSGALSLPWLFGWASIT